MKPALPFDEAQRRLIDLVSPLGKQLVATQDCIGRYLRAPLPAARTQPAADLSAMDGYALPDGDAETWRIIGESAAGRPFAERLGPGESARISTGALMPDGATRVLLQEEAIVEGNRLVISPGGQASPHHIRRKGFDFRKGDIVLPKGMRIGPAQLALALSAGYGAGKLTVGRLPRVAIIDSGNELSDDPATMAPSQIPASNGAMLAAMAAPFAADVERIGPVPDTMEALAEAFDSASDAHVMVTSGGASVGDHDLVRPALEACGAKIDFWRIAMKPGKPLLVARRGTQIVLGLPGNPVSSYVTAWFFLLPLLRRLAGAATPLPSPLRLPLAASLPAVGPRTEFVRARFGPDGLTPVIQQDSSALGALAVADLLIRREAGDAAARPGDVLPAYPLQNGANA